MTFRISAPAGPAVPQRSAFWGVRFHTVGSWVASSMCSMSLVYSHT